MATPHRSAEHRTRGRDAAALIGRIAGGDESALAALYDTTCGPVYGLLLRILGDPAEAEQVLVTVYGEVWERAATYDEEREEALTWLITLAHRRTVGRVREGVGGREPQAFLTETDAHAPAFKHEHEGPASELQRVLRSAFAALPPAQRQLIELAYFSGLRQDEIAERLGLPLRSVRAGMRAGMTTLRDAFRVNTTLFRPQPPNTNGGARRLPR